MIRSKGWPRTLHVWNVDSTYHVTRSGAVLRGFVEATGDYGNRAWNGVQPVRADDLTAELVDRLVQAMGEILVRRQLPGFYRWHYEK